MNQGKINVSVLLLVLVSLGLFFLLVHGGSFLLFRILNRPHPEPNAEKVFRKTLQNPQGPFLEESVSSDLEQLRNHEGEILNSYGWVDPSQGIIHIPINRAIELMSREKKTP